MKENSLYLDYVKRGKDLVHQVECYQIQIAYYATKVCEIKHGGKAKVYTLSKYAKDIGLPTKTVQNWVQVYRNVIVKIEIDKEKVSPKDWSVASRVNNLLAKQRIVDNALNGTKGSKKLNRQTLPSGFVKDLFNQNYHGPSVQMNVLEWRDSTIVIKNKLLGRDMTTVSISSLISLKEALDQASEACYKHIAIKAKCEKELKEMEEA